MPLASFGAQQAKRVAGVQATSDVAVKEPEMSAGWSTRRVADRVMRGGSLLAAMVALQVLWVVLIWLTGVASSPRKLPRLLVYSVVGGAAVGSLPARFVSGIREFKGQLLHNEKFLILTLCTVVVAIGAVYARYQIVLGNEGNLFDASKMVAEQGIAGFFASYTTSSWLASRHPPLIPVVYGFAIRIFGIELFVIRLVSVLLTLATTLITYFLGRKLYDRETGLLAALLLLCNPSFFRFGVTGLLDMPMTLCFALILLSILRLMHTPAYSYAAVAGILIGVGLLCKYTMVLMYPLVLSYCATQRPLKPLKLHVGVMVIVSAAMLAPWLAYAYHVGLVGEQVDTLVSYVGYGKKWRLEALLIRLPSALGAYTIPILLLGGLSLACQRSQSDLFVLLWIGIVSVVLIFTLPEPRYFMPAFPAFAIAMARGLRHVPDAVERIVLLALLYCGGALYLFADWYRTVPLLSRSIGG